MIDLENKEERNKLIDDFFNKGLDCNIKEVYQAVVNTIADLEYEDVKKAKEIERLNNIINDFEEELEREVNIKKEDTGLEHNTYIDINNTLKTVLKRFRELKGSDK